MPRDNLETTGEPRLAIWFRRVVGAEVHRREWPLVGLLFANLFVLLTAYYILKVIREPLILVGGSAVQRSYARATEAGVLMVLIPAYGMLANRFEPARLVRWIMAAFVVCLAGFYVARRAGAAVGFPFFVWLGIFSTFSIAQFWSVANDVMTEAQGRRLFPLVAVGGTAGGVAGAQFAARAIAHLAPETMMVIAAGLVVACIMLTHAAHAAGLAERVGAGGAAPSAAAAPRDARGGFTLVLRDRYLSLIALSVIAVNLITATGDFLLARLVSATAHALPAAARARYVGAFYGDLQTWVTVLTALSQMLLVPRLFRRVGVRGALLFMPFLVVVGYGSFAIAPLLVALTVLKLAESTADYSLENTIQHALFLPTSREAKYKAKSAIDTVGKRLGDLGSAALVFLGTRAAFGLREFAVVNLAAGLLWLWLSLQLRRPGPRPLPAIGATVAIDPAPAAPITAA